MNDSSGYLFAVGKIKALESRLMDQGTIQRMIDAPDYDEALRYLGDTEYAGRMGKHDYEAAVSAVVREVNLEVASFSPDPYFTGMFYAEQDFLRLKAALKGVLLAKAGIEVTMRAAGVHGWTDKQETDSIAQEAANSEHHTVSWSPLPVDEILVGEADKLTRALRKAAFTAVLRYREAGNDPLEIDTAIDREFFSYLSIMATSRRAEWASKLVAAKADMANVLLIVRAFASGKDLSFIKSALVPGGTLRQEDLMECAIEGEARIRRALEGSAYWRKLSPAFEEWARSSAIRPLEMAFERIAAGMEKEARVMTDGYVPVMGYLLMKQREAVILRRVLAGKAKSLLPRFIRERMSEGDA